MVNGATILFAFFMISDPKTIPQSRFYRFTFASLVSALTMFFQFGLYIQGGLIYSLVIVSLLNPIFNSTTSFKQFKWSTNV